MPWGNLGPFSFLKRVAIGYLNEKWV